MPRRMSVAMTQQQVRDRTKTVTRRKGWWLDKHGRHLVKAGDHLVLVDRVMGFKKGERATVLAEVEVVSVRREPLGYVLLKRPPSAPRARDYGRDEMVREGFPGMDPLTFVDRYFSKAQGITAAEDVTRIEWRYLDGGDDDYLRACECQECGEPVDVTATDCFQCGASLTPTEAGER